MTDDNPLIRDDDSYQHKCQNCGRHVSTAYARVRSLDGERNPRACGNCRTKAWQPKAVGEGGDDDPAREKRHAYSTHHSDATPRVRFD